MSVFAENQIERRRSVANTQRIVYNWYETHHYDEEIIDIYSPEWAERITEWQEWLFKTHHTINVNPSILKLQLRTPEQIGLPLLFSAYPVAAFSLWQTLQACYDLDKAVCLNATQKTEEWQSLRPFEYMMSEEVETTWCDELKLFKKQIQMQTLETGEIKSRIYALFRSLESLETLVQSAKENFVDLDVEIRELMLEKIEGMLDQRCNMIAKILKVEGEEEKHEDTDNSYETSDLAENISKLDERPLSTPTKGRRGSGRKRSLSRDQRKNTKRRH